VLPVITPMLGNSPYVNVRGKQCRFSLQTQSVTSHHFSPHGEWK